MPTLLNLACCAILVHRTTLRPPPPTGISRGAHALVQGETTEIKYNSYRKTSRSTTHTTTHTWRYCAEACGRVQVPPRHVQVLALWPQVHGPPSRRGRPTSQPGPAPEAEPTSSRLLGRRTHVRPPPRPGPSSAAPSLTAHGNTTRSATPCLFTFDRLGCYNAWHDADDPGVVKGVRKEAVLDPAATDT